MITGKGGREIDDLTDHQFKLNSTYCHIVIVRFRSICLV